MRAIAAVDEHWGIGRDGKLLIRIPADQRNFKEETMGCPVILGRKTLQTFPQGMPLAGRTNLILTRNPDFKSRGEEVFIVHSEEELLETLRSLGIPTNTDPIGSAWVIGGESIYRLLLPYCTEALLSRIERTYDADAFFPNLAEAPDWELTWEGEEQVYFDTTWHLERWVRKSGTGR